MKANKFVKKFGLDSFKAACLCPQFKRYNYAILYSDEVDFSNDFIDKHADYMFKTSEVKRLVESHELVSRVDFWGRIDKGLIKAKMVIDNNTLQASYYQPCSGAYYRYGHNSIYIVENDKWKEIYVGMNSSSLIHTNRLKQAIEDVENCQ